MNNPKTTVVGILSLIIAIAMAVKGLLMGATVDWSATIAAVMAALTGLGFWASTDGGA